VLLTLQNRINNPQNFLLLDGFKKSVYDGLKQILLAGPGTAISANDAAGTITFGLGGPTTLRLEAVYPIVASKPDFNIWWQGTEILGGDQLDVWISPNGSWTGITPIIVTVTTNALGAIEMSYTVPTLADGTYTARVNKLGVLAYSPEITFIVDNLSALAATRQSAFNNFTPVIRVTNAGGAADANTTQTVNVRLTQGATVINFPPHALGAGEIAAGIFTTDLTAPEPIASGTWAIEVWRNNGAHYSFSFKVNNQVTIGTPALITQQFVGPGTYTYTTDYLGNPISIGAGDSSRRTRFVVNCVPDIGTPQFEVQALSTDTFATLTPIKVIGPSGNSGFKSALFEIANPTGTTINGIRVTWVTSNVFGLSIQVIPASSSKASTEFDFTQLVIPNSATSPYNWSAAVDPGEVGFFGAVTLADNRPISWTNATEDAEAFQAAGATTHDSAHTTTTGNLTGTMVFTGIPANGGFFSTLILRGA
jgi:hypothetical protein